VSSKLNRPQGDDVTDHDAIVIGLGVGGEETATRLAAGGLDVLAVERKLVGGECPYWGCIPSKVMVRAGTSLAEAARATGLAGRLEISPEWAPVARRVREVTADWNDEAAVKRHQQHGVSVLRGEARLVGPGIVEVDGVRHRARRAVVIATGGEPAAPPIEGLADGDYWTNREAIEAAELPGSLITLGAGPIGLELAQTFRRFGCRVVIVEAAPRVLAPEEPENSAAMQDALQAEGIEVLTGAKTQSVAWSPGRVSLSLEGGREVEGEQLLVATGRRHNLAALGLETVGLDPRAKSIEVDEHLRAGPGLWAVGDVTGVGEFTHVAVYQGRVAASDILGGHAHADYGALPRVTYTDPEVASVGLSQAQAEEAGLTVKVGVAETSSSARGFIHGPGAEHGVIKLIADVDAGVLVGASVMAPAAGEIIGLCVLAIKARVPITVLKDVIYPYPTFVRGLEDALKELS
jgi:pyruvate/2-oxoglutarate dehydrogenase complex dihydrolipoamide dehydrogenase (E3) component